MDTKNTHQNDSGVSAWNFQKLELGYKQMGMGNYILCKYAYMYFSRKGL